jgi:cytochrome c oxidase assembly protein subunit 11
MAVLFSSACCGPEPVSSGNKEIPLSNVSLVRRLLFMALAMFGFGFLLVPIYDAFCEVTGLGGKTNKTPITMAESSGELARPDRLVDLEFVTTVNQHAPWAFAPQVESMDIIPGALYEATFIARNLTDQERIAQAVPSVAPSQAAKYLKKLDCFCFSEQAFAPGEERELQVRFVVDSELPEYIETLTLSYTFFDSASSNH